MSDAATETSPTPHAPAAPRAAGPLRPLVRHLTFPLFTFGPAAGALALLVPTGDVGANPSAAALLGCAGIIVGCYLALALLERLAPHRTSWNEGHGDLRTDVAYFVFVGPATAAVAATAATALVSVLHDVAPGTASMRLWPTEAPIALQLLFACVVAELGHYAVHRLGHEWPLVWRLHAIHHSAERLYWLNATRFHPLDLLLIAFAQVLPLHLLGIPTTIYVAYVVASSVYGQLQHGNVELDARAYGLVFATPELHRWHHSTDPREGDSNYGAILILWDVLLRTRFWPGRPIEAAVGIGSMPRFPRGFLAQLAAPFRWSTVERESGADPSPDAAT